MKEREDEELLLREDYDSDTADEESNDMYVFTPRSQLNAHCLQVIFRRSFG